MRQCRSRVSLALNPGLRPLIYECGRASPDLRNSASGGELAIRSQASQHRNGPSSLNRSTISQLRDDIDAGRTGDKIDWPDPAAVPLGTDEEAAGTPPDPWAVETARDIEVSRPCKSIAHRGVGAAWLLIAFAAALGSGLVAWILWQGGWTRS
jgi:hypothetical protein